MKVMILFDLSNGWESADSYRRLLTGIRLQIVCHKSVDDINHRGRRVGAMTMRATSVRPNFPPVTRTSRVQLALELSSSEHLLRKSTCANPGSNDVTSTRSSCKERNNTINVMVFRLSFGRDGRQTSVANQRSSVLHMQEPGRP